MSRPVRTRPLVRRTIDWIDEAPVALRARTVTTAAPDAVFAVLADHERFPEWFPNVKSVEVTGEAAGVGAERRVFVPGLVVDEEFIAWEPGVRWAFTGTAVRPGFVRSLVEDCRIAVVDGKTEVTYTMYLDPSPGWGLGVRAAGPVIRRSIRRALAALAERAS